MGAITGTLGYSTPLAGKRLVTITCSPASASDTVTLTLASHGVRTIYAVISVLTAGQDANLQTIYATFSGLVITLATLNAAGAAATDWTDAAALLLCIAD